MQVPRCPRAFPTEAAAGTGTAVPRPPFLYNRPTPAPPAPGKPFYLRCKYKRPGADSERSPRVSQARRAAAASANRGSLGTPRPGAPRREEGRAPARDREGRGGGGGGSGRSPRAGAHGERRRNGLGAGQAVRSGHARAERSAAGRGLGRGRELGESSEELGGKSGRRGAFPRGCRAALRLSAPRRPARPAKPKYCLHETPSG